MYRAYNLSIDSEISLPELTITQQPPNVFLRIGKLNNSDEIISNRGSSFVGEVAGVASFAVIQGREIFVEPAADVEVSLLRTIILGPILSILLRQRGLLVLHASCVVVNNFAIAFLGYSGAGKSTLADAFHTQGYSILTEDVTSIEFKKDYPEVIPAFPQVKLLPDAATSLGYHAGSLPQIHSQTEKIAHKLMDGFCQTSVPLQGIYVLSQGTDHNITKLNPQQAFVELVRHSRAASLLTHPTFVGSHLQQCTTLVQNVPIYHFQRRLSLSELPKLVNLVVEHSKETVCQEFAPIPSPVVSRRA